MPVTPQQLIALMFGQELKQQSRDRINLDAAQEVLTLDNVHLRGKRVSIQDFSLHVRAGEIIGLAGLDESGQELVMRACVGLLNCAHGRVLVRGKDMTHRPYRRFLNSGIVFCAAGRLEEGLIAGLTLTEHTALVAEDRMAIDWQRAHFVTDQKLKLYNVHGRVDSRIETLSGGNQQRMLMALLPEKPLVTILEQPTRGLDVESAQWIWSQLLARRAQGTAIIFSSPDLDELVAYSDRILVFYAGHVFEIASASETTIDELGRLIGGHFDE